MAFELFRAKGHIGLDDRELTTGLRATERKFDRLMKKIDRTRATSEIDAELDGVQEAIKKAEHLGRQWARKEYTAEFKADANNARKNVQRLDQRVKQLTRKRHELKLEARGVQETERELARVARHLRRVQSESTNTSGGLRRLSRALRETRVHFGVVSVTARAFLGVLSALGPVGVGLAGTLTSLVGVLGTGLTGALGLALGAFGGLLPLLGATAGLFGANANAIDKFSERSSGLQKLRRQVAALAKDVRPDLMKTLRSGVSAATRLFPTFASRAKAAFGIVNQEARRGFRAASTPQAIRGWDTILGRAQRALRPLLRGLGHLAAAGGRVAVSFSRFLPGMARGFNRWAKSISDSTRDTGRLDQRVNRLVRHARTTGGFFMQLGRTIRAVFSAAAGEGDPMMKNMTRWLKDVENWAGSPRAEKFFARARAMTEKVWGAVKEVAKFLGRWFEAIEPFVAIFIDVVKYAGKLLNWVIDMTGGSKGLIRALAGLVIINKAVKWAGMLGRALKAMVVPTAVLSALGLPGGRRGRAPTRGPGGTVPVPIGSGGRGGRAPMRGPGGTVPVVPVLTAGRGGAGRAKGVIRTLLKGTGLALGPIGWVLTIGMVAGPSMKKVLDSFDPEKRFRGNIKRIQRDDSGSILAPWLRKMLGQKLPVRLEASKADLAKVQKTIRSLSKTKPGRMLVNFVARGDKAIKDTFHRLARTKLGSKLLKILSKGGPEGQKTLQRLSRTRVGNKLMRIVERGGKPAQKILAALQNKKMRSKVLRILERGGPHVEKKLAKIIGLKLNKKTQKFDEKGAKEVDRKIARLKRARLGKAVKKVEAPTALDVLSLLNDIKNFNIGGALVKVVKIAVKGAKWLLGRQSGGELREDQEEREMNRAAAAAEPTQGEVIRRPRFIVGEDAPTWPEVVLASNPAFRDRNVELWEQAGRMLGIEGFRRGGKRGRGRKKRRGGGDADNTFYEMDRDLRREARETELADAAANLRERQMQTHGPSDEDLINADGTRNEAAISQRIGWLQQTIGDKRKLYDELSSQVQAVGNAISDARWAGRSGDVNRRDARDRVDDLIEQRDQLRNRLQEVDLEMSEIKREIKQVRATKETTTPYEREAARREADFALAELTPDTTDDAAALRNLLMMEENRVMKARGLLINRDPYDDFEAYQQITAGAQAMKGYREQLEQLGAIQAGGGSGATTDALSAFTSARLDLYRQFGGNMGRRSGRLSGANIELNQRFERPPPDPHTWSQSVMHELEATL